MQHRILNTIGSVFTKDARVLLSKLGEVEDFNGTQKELTLIIADYTIAIIGLGLNFNKKVIQNAPKLQLIGTATTGLDHIDLEYAKARGVDVLSLYGESTFLNTITGTAELAVGLMIDCMRGISNGFSSVQQYIWDREQFRGYSLYEKTLGIVGFGRLGKMMARYCIGFGMNVIIYDIEPDEESCKKIGVRAVEFETLLNESDVVSIHIPLNQKTKYLFNDNIFLKMKSTAYLINTARGLVINENSLLTALKERYIAGYATDVLADEVNFSEGFSNHALVEYAKTHRNLLITPHIGGMTHESRTAADIFIAEKVVQWAYQKNECRHNLDEEKLSHLNCYRANSQRNPQQ